ncbi:MAG: metallophosphoesterase [Promethearchaeota archaeon]
MNLIGNNFVNCQSCFNAIEYFKNIFAYKYREIGFSGWAIAMIILGIVIPLIYIYIIAQYRAHIPVYQSAKFVFNASIVSIIYGEIRLWIHVYRDYYDIKKLAWPQYPLYFLFIVYFMLITFLLYCLIKFGRQALKRFSFRNFKDWGPYLTFTKNPCNSIRIAWRDDPKNETGKRKKNIVFLGNMDDFNKKIPINNSFPKTKKIPPITIWTESQDPDNDSAEIQNDIKIKARVLHIKKVPVKYIIPKARITLTIRIKRVKLFTFLKGMHYLEISNLKPNTRYFYKINYREQIYSFKTSPCSLRLPSSPALPEHINISINRKNDKKEKGNPSFKEGDLNNIADELFNFLVIGDLHAGGNDVSWFVRILEDNYHDANFMLTLGDLVSDSQKISHWKTFFGQFKNVISLFPLIYLPGNHDGYFIKGYRNWRTFLWQPYANPLIGGFFSVTYLNTHLIMLDNFNAARKYKLFSWEQKEWLEKELEKAESSPKIDNIFLFMHYPPISTGDSGVDPDLLPIFMRIVKKYTKIKLVIAGHIHLYQSFIMNVNKERKVAFIVSGGGGGDLEKAVLHQLVPRPYHWTSDGIDTPPKFIPDNYWKKDLQNNDIIRKFHHKSAILHHFLRIFVRKDKIIIEVIDKENQKIDEIVLV